MLDLSNLQFRFQSTEIFYLSNYSFCTQLRRIMVPLPRHVSGKAVSTYESGRTIGV